MPAPELFDQHLTDPPVMAIFRGKSPDETVALCHAAWEAGIELVEVPVQSHEAMASFEAAVAAGRASGKLVGAGTVLSVTQLDTVIEAGAAFSVAPGLDDDVVERAARRGLPHLPGVATSSEIARAVRLGCRWLKAFPAAELGTAWAAAQLGPFPAVRFVATGGVSAQNVSAFLDGGFSAVAVGSAFETPEGIAALSTSLEGRKTA